VASRHRGRSGGGGRGFLKSARVEWLEVNDAGQQVDSLTSAVQNVVTQMYAFGSATKYADNYGAGDWTATRSVGAMGVASTGTKEKRLYKVCVGIGFAQTANSVSVSTDPVDIPLPFNSPEVSWMVYICCYINAEQLVVERCEFDMRGQRRIGPQSILYKSVAVTPGLTSGTILTVGTDLRLLMKQRGSRL